MLALQKMGCHNINLVTPTHVIHPVLRALPIAVGKGLSMPLVYNCGGYERVSALKLLDGIVDIYMPDFKFWEAEAAKVFAAPRTTLPALVKHCGRCTGRWGNWFATGQWLKGGCWCGTW